MDYKKQLVKFRIDKIAELSVILFVVPFVIAAALNILLVKRPLLLTGKVYFDIMIMIAVYLVGLVCHEGLHALGAMLFAKKTPADISFGANLKQGMLYCHVKTPMKNASYQALLLLPVIVTGIIPLIISVVFGNIFLVVAFSLLTSGGAGDIIMFSSLLKHDKKQLILDHAQAPAYYLVYPENELPETFVEVTETQEEELLEEMKKPNQGSRNNMLKILAVMIFLALAVAGIFVAALFMKLF